MTPIVAFLNPPFWQRKPTDKPDEFYLLRAIRAGSRWPFTIPSSFAPDHYRLGEYLPYPMYLGSAAGWLKKQLPEATIIFRDSIARGESYEKFDDWWHETRPTHVIMETGGACVEHDLRYVKAMKESNPSVRVALAGPPAHTLSTRTDTGHVDAFILGELEKGSVEFVRGRTGVIPFMNLSQEEMWLMPHPLFDEPFAHRYADANPRGAPWPELLLWAIRGCYFKCNFCSQPATMSNDDPLGQGKRKIRFHDPEWLEAFIRERMTIHEKSGFPLKAVRFDGDSDNASDRHTRNICEMMRRIKLPWSMMCRADTTSKEVWAEMHVSGCFGVKIGFESASNRITNQIIGKKLDLGKAETTCRYLREIGMEVHSTWIIGHQTETKEEMKLTLDTIQRFYDDNIHSSHQLSGAATLDGAPLSHANITDPNFIHSADGRQKVDMILNK